MKLHRHLLALGLALSSALTAQAAAPANDSATKATLFTSNYQVVTAQNLSLATASTTDPLINGASAGRTLWYRINGTPEVAAPTWTVEVRSTTAAGSLSFYELLDPDNPISSLEQRGSTVSFSAGQTVRLTIVASNSSRYMAMVAGTGTFDLVQRSGVSNDFPVGAIALTGNKGTVTGNNRAATYSDDEPPSIGSHTVWYKWTATSSAPVFMDTNFSFIVPESVSSYTNLPASHNTYLAVFTGTPEALVSLVADDDHGWQDNSLVNFTPTAGTTYYISVGTSGSLPGEITLNYYPTSNSGGEIYFPNASLGASYENADSHACVVRRRYGGTNGASCTFTTTGGTATATSDYQTKTTTISFNFAFNNVDDAWEMTVPVNLVNDTASEASETVGLVLSGVSATATLGLANATFTIVDDDTDNNSMIIGQPVIRVKESAGIIYNSVIRTGNTGAQINLVQYPFAGYGNASLGQDFYSTASNVINAGSTVGNLGVQIVDDNKFEGVEEVAQLIVNVPGYPSYLLIIEDDDPFIPVPGRLVANLNYSSDARGAMINASVSSSGLITGKATLPGQTLSFKAQFDLRGHATTLLYPTGRTPLVLTFQALSEQGNCDIQLIDPSTDSYDWESDVALINFSKTKPCPFAGRYTVVMDGFSGVDCLGGLAITLDIYGTGTISGRLFDGTAVTATGYMDSDTDFISVISLYGGKGMLNLSIGLPTPSDAFATTGDGYYTRPARTGDATKLGAVVESFSLKSCRYTPPPSGQRALEVWSTGTGHATLQGGPMPAMTTKTLTISTANKITVPVDTNQLKLTLNPATGLFTGSVIPAAGAKPLSIFGALLDQPTTFGYGKGFFFDGLKGGVIQLGQ